VTSAVPGVKQIDLTINYDVPNVLPFFPGDYFALDFQKPIYLYTE